ncbi:hypothetical protein HRI_002360600 [Hibiscus trionum]|uniref:At2g35280-like TPR domain-containing protein n=1 Tax=Hibiscus trionum TaxID=183268 RepID=A0A9W7M3X0_HIBTR|nr:hypothetical protein HRI_002360600 [Hibiscus trionum]
MINKINNNISKETRIWSSLFEKSDRKGHVEVIYAYEIILICLRGDIRKQGFQIVSSLNLVNSSKRSSRTIANCRSKIERFLSYMKNSMCTSSSEGKAWETRNDLGHCCDSSFRDREATLFCRVLRKYLVA